MDKGGYDLRIHSSVEDLEIQLEAIDVKNDEYEAYDAEGRLLTLGVIKKETPIFFGLFKSNIEHVIVESVEHNPGHEKELRDALIKFLQEEHGIARELLHNLSTDKLIQKVAKISHC